MTTARVSDRSFYYAGIGSRETPLEVRGIIDNAVITLNGFGYGLRSGGASGADEMFEAYADSRWKQIYLPWAGFNGNSSWRLEPSTEAMQIAKDFHPAWDKCSPSAKLLHARNTHIILGLRCDNPVDFVLCWTKDAKGGGGTGQGLRIARAYSIPIFDFADEDQRRGWLDIVQQQLTASEQFEIFDYARTLTGHVRRSCDDGYVWRWNCIWKNGVYEVIGDADRNHKFTGQHRVTRLGPART